MSFENPRLNERAQSFGMKTDYLSEVYAMAVTVIPKPPEKAPACATCPGGMWFVTDGLTCFCKVTKQIVWGLNRAAVVACDGREALLSELAKKRRDGVEP